MTVFEEIQKELDYQSVKYGHETDDTLNNPWMWTAYLTQQAGRWMQGSFLPFSTKNVDAFRVAMIKVAAVAISAIQSLDRQREKGKAFYEATD